MHLKVTERTLLRLAGIGLNKVFKTSQSLAQIYLCLMIG